MGKAKVLQPKKFTTSALIIYLVIGVVIVGLCWIIGAAMDYAVRPDGSVDGTLLGEAFNTVTASPDLIFAALKRENSYAPKMIFLGAASVGIFILYKYTEERKRLHRRGVEHGSAEWGDDNEKKSLADKGKASLVPIKSPEDGKRVFDDKGNFVSVTVDNNILLTEDVFLSLNAKQHLLNLNILVIGGSGSGKTRFFAKPNIMQLNTSYVVTDPKGEILQSTGQMLLKAGYRVRVLNLIQMQHSNNYNPFHYVYDQDGRLSEDNIKKMVNVLFKNTKGEGEKDDFWSQKGQTLLEAIVFLLFEESEYDAKFDENGEIIPETRDQSHLNFFSVTEKMRKLQYPPRGSQAPDGFFLAREAEETEEAFRTRQAAAFLCPLDKDFIELEKRKGETLAGRLYKEVRNAPEETGQSFLSSANVRTFMFNLTNLQNLTCCDNIHLETLGDEKTALFLIISATDSTYNFMAATLYTQMFDVLANRANFKYGGVLPVHVRCIMDEFANVGQIPDFDKVIAFVRSMGMSLNVIIQNLAQLKAKYEKTWEVITGNCDSLLFLGGKEESTLKSISESLGKETIDVKGQNRTKGGKQTSTAENNSIMGRELMQPNELSTMPISDCVLMIRSHNPFYCRKFPIQDHVNYDFLEDAHKENAFDVKTIHAISVKELEESMQQSTEKVDTCITNPEGETLEMDKMDVVFQREEVTVTATEIDLESYAKQKQPCRRIQDYYKHISDSKREEAYYEIIVQFGDSKTAPCGSPNGEIAKQMLDEYIREFKKRNPNLHIFNAVLHMDEASPHLHIDFIPFYTVGRINGLSKGVSMKAALDEQGFTAKNFKQNRLVAWEESEREEMERILHRHGFTRDDKNAKYAHQTVEQYKKSQDEKKIVAAIRKTRQITDADLEQSRVQQLRTRLHSLERENEILENQKRSPYKSFFYADAEKQAFVQFRMDELGIPYHETENGFEAQECYVDEIRKIEKEYKPKRSVARDKLREDIDRLLMQSDSLEDLLEKLKAEGYTIHTGKYLSIKPPYAGQSIRIKSLGEQYSEYALKNRINARKKFQATLAQKINAVQKKGTPEYLVLRTMQFYTIAFTDGALPMRKRDARKPFAWTNDAELDKLTALNAKINSGATLQSLRTEMERTEESVSEKEKQVEKEKKDLQSFYELKEKIQIVFEGKKSDVFTLEQAQRTIQQYGKITASNYRNVDVLIENQMQSLQKAESALAEEQKKLKETSDMVSAMEKVMGGTYVQSLVGEERQRRESKFVPNGTQTV